ncbi:Hemolysin C [Aminobacter sp. MSH1]|uniref:CBS domain containing-hemolysin-like protein n=1 Tax=Aminobacter niigataensis TaxID=83265 RepID=A0ABR6L798_9HYPH|nr:MULTISPECIES: hemolysin family protein [Aminobacter]AWC20596.1 Hemolysin C [Aminobacter sp. MSH1]MBB4652687.1 CBS domain containing-hemolysin-like protein [Aminobacter niigataensis]
MNDKTETAATPEPGTAARASDQTEDGPSTSAPLTATHDTQAERPSFIERLTRLFRHRSNGTNIREEIVDALAETGSDADSFSPGERAMLNNILRLREVRVEDVMVPRADIEAIELSTTLGELLSVFEQSGHSRMPVYVETLDDPRGMVHIRDVLAHITRGARVKKGRSRKAQAAEAQLDLSQVDLQRSIGDLNLVRTVLFVPPSMLASDLMTRMQATRTQMALVIDEYGGTDGLVSLEDIVEMVVGDIEDEHDDDEPMITQAGDGVYVVDGKAEIEEVAKVLGEEFSAGEHSEYVDTIGGMIFNALGRVPARGEVVQAIPGFEFHVLDADPRRVKRVRIVHSVKSERRRRAKAEQA